MALKKYYDDVIRVQSAARAFFARKSKTLVTAHTDVFERFIFVTPVSLSH